MKGKGEPNGWITRNGVHVPIFGAYTVRGGVEPKAKSAKFKRKRPDDLRAKDIHGQERLINRKDLEDALAEAKLKAKNATNEHEWRQYEDEAKEIQKALDGKGVSPLVAKNYGKLSAKKKPSMSEEDKTARTVADHYGVSVDKAKEGIASGKYSDGGREITNITMDKKAEKVAPGQVEGKKTNKTPEGEDTSKKDWYVKDVDIPKEETKAAKQKRISRELADEAHAGETGWKEKTYTKEELAEQESGKNLSIHDTRMQRQSVNKAAGLKTDENQNFKQAYNKSTPEDYAKSQGKTMHDMASEVLKDPDAHMTARQLMQDGRSYNEAAALAYQSHLEKKQESSTSTIHETRLQRQAVNEKAGLKSDRNQNFKTAYQNEQTSSTPDFSKMSYSEAGKYVAAHREEFGLSPKDDAYLAGAQMKSGTWKGDSTVKENRDWAKRMNEKHIVTESNAGSRYSTDSASYANSYVAQNVSEMSISGLKSAYKDAPAAVKSKIKAEMRQRGYKFTGGKWVKG